MLVPSFVPSLSHSKIPNSFDIYLSEISSYSVTSEKTDKTLKTAQMMRKVNSIFDEIFKIYTEIKKWIYRICKRDV